MTKREIYVKDLGSFISGQRDKSMKAILLSIEKYLQKGTKEHADVRNTVLDTFNDFYAIICLAVENSENGDGNGEYR